MNNNKGIALIITLWVLALLMTLAMNLSFSTRFGNASTRNFKEDTQAYYLAMSAYEEALSYLITDPDAQIDFIDDKGNFYTDAERDTITGTRKTNGAEVSLKITDEESRLNINVLNESLLKETLEYAGVPDESLQEMVDTLADWKDPDDLHRLMGAEDEYYLELGYKAKNSHLSVPEEIMLVKGYKPEYYIGEDEKIPLEKLITVWGGHINVNTASEDVLSLLGLNPIEIDTIINNRKNKEGLTTVPSQLAVFGRTYSASFRIEAAARVNDSPIAVKIIAVVKISRDSEGTKVRTLYWKEDVESSWT